MWEMLVKAYGESPMKKEQVSTNSFQDERKNIDDDKRLGHPSTSRSDKNVKKVIKMIMIDPRITIREVADEVGIWIGLCHDIISLFWV